MNASQSRGPRGCFSILIFIFVFIIVVRLRPSTARPEKENPVEELSREDLVEMFGYGENKLSSVLVTGSVLCEAPMDEDSEPLAWPVSGSRVAVACKSITQNMKADGTEALTDEYGDFIVDLPSHLHAVPNLEKACTVRVLSLPETSPCNRVFERKPKGISLASIGNGIRTYTAGTITYTLSASNYRAERKESHGEMNFW